MNESVRNWHQSGNLQTWHASENAKESKVKKNNNNSSRKLILQVLTLICITHIKGLL